MIAIDDRETKLIERFVERNIEHKIDRLFIADAQVSSRLPIEIKRIFYNDNGEVVNDVMASLIDSRYREQSENRKEIYELNAVIIQISVKDCDLFNKSFTYNRFMGFVISIQYRYHSMFFLTDDQDGTIDIILALHKRENEAGISDPINRPPKPKTLYQRQRYFIAGLIGAGKKIVDELFIEYHTPINILASIINGQIINVKGIGKIFLKSNKELLRKKAEKKDGEKNE